ncbi:hypothetical protein BJF90_02215 [Pseudonocardia sp. CNS-004]|nr:hypothetical protein BJF90_02215 [Pseudonocardia sp. CNS-004]
MAKPQRSGEYVARFGFNRKAVLVVLCCAAFTAACILLPDMHVLTRSAGLLLFGVGGLLFLVISLKGGVAFRADEEGITLGNPPVGVRRPELHVPWASIDEVVLFRQDAGAATVPHVGLRLRPGAPAVNTGIDRDGRVWQGVRRLVPHVPEDVLAHSRAISGWRLDEERLAQALDVHAPHVRIVPM